MMSTGASNLLFDFLIDKSSALVKRLMVCEHIPGKPVTVQGSKLVFYLLNMSLAISVCILLHATCTIPYLILVFTVHCAVWVHMASWVSCDYCPFALSLPVLKSW